MPADTASTPITIRASKATVEEIDAYAAAMDRSRNYVINQAIEQFLQHNGWQVERIQAGLAAAREGQVLPAEDVFAEIAASHGWKI